MPVVAVAGGASSTGDPAKDFNAVPVRKDSPMRSAKDLVGKRAALKCSTS